MDENETPSLEGQEDEATPTEPEAAETPMVEPDSEPVTETSNEPEEPTLSPPAAEEEEEPTFMTIIKGGREVRIERPY